MKKIRGSTDMKIEEINEKNRRKIEKQVALSSEFFIDCLNETLNEFNPGLLTEKITVHTDKINAHYQSIDKVAKGKFKGIWTFEHIFSILQPLSKWFRSPRDIVICGAEQSAKTVVYASCFMLLPILEKLIGNRTLIPVIFSVNRNNITLGTIKELEVINGLYKDVEFGYKGKKEKFSYVRDFILDEIVYNLYDQQTQNWESLVFNREPHKLKEFSEKILSKNYNQAVFLDESHVGCGKKQMVDNLLKENKDKAIKEMSEYKNWKDKMNIREISVSATPTEQSTKKTQNMSLMWLNEKDGSWIGKCNGIVFPTISGESVKPPEVLSIEQSFPTITSYIDKHMQKQEDEDEESPYSLCEDENFISDFLKCLTVLPSKEKNVIFIRPSNYINPCKKFADLIKESNNFEIIEYFGKLDKNIFGKKKKNEKTLKEVIIDGYKDKPTLIVCGGGRAKCGDSFPSNVKFYFDFCKTIYTWESFRQSTIGRSSGFGKNSIVYFPNKICEQWTEYYNNGCTDKNLGGPHPSRRTRKLNGNNRGRKSGVHFLEIN